MLFNTVFKMTKVGNSPYVRRQPIPEFTAIVRKILQAMGFDLWNRKKHHFYCHSVPTARCLTRCANAKPRRLF